MSLVSLERDGALAVITLDNPPQNRINERMAAELAEAIRARGVAVRRVAGTGGEALRVTVGRPEENDRFLEIWKEVAR